MTPESNEPADRFTARTVTCPCCGGPSLYGPGNPYRPFCSERCRKIDLGAWANEEFRVPTSPPLEPDQDPNGLRH
ncbi:MAG TPA: DNA gyrase inhibitor YacG [Macromonas sp.]|nr:DNA gyrase inhibitor YacG [Macromonas sp.]